MDEPLSQERLADMALQAERTLKQLEDVLRDRRKKLTSATRRGLMSKARSEFKSFELTYETIQEKKRALALFRQVRDMYGTSTNEEWYSAFLMKLWTEMMGPDVATNDGAQPGQLPNRLAP
jgi:hypothetical protein